MWVLIWFQDGLFTAFLSAFLVFLIPQLQTNSTDVAMDVLIHISQQLSNSTIPAFGPTAFQVSSNAATVNMLFLLSLALVLIHAYFAMLVRGWLQEFNRGYRWCTVAHLRAQEHERRLQGLERLKLDVLFGLLPILIQGSLLLFCIGLIVLIFPLHLSSGMLCSCLFVPIVGFYGFTTYISIVDSYAPFTSPFSRLLARGLMMLKGWCILITDNTKRITAHPLPSNNGVTKPARPPKLDGVEKSNIVPRFRSDIYPETHLYVLERLVSTTVMTADNIPIFLELLDQPVKDVTLWPFDMDKWRTLLHITLELLRDQPTLPVSTAWTLARTMITCYNRETADRQLCHTLQHQLGSRETNDQRPRMPFNRLISSYLSFWSGDSNLDVLSWTIAFLEPSDAADAELFWMVNTFHKIMPSENHDYLGFYIAVLTYVSSTEQSKRPKVPLTAAVINAMHTIRSALDQGYINSIDVPCILPGTVSTVGSLGLMFCHVDSAGSLDLWSDGCIQLVEDLLQWNWGSYYHHEIQLSLVAALYIDTIKQAHARSTFADLLGYTRITNIESQFSDSYDSGKLAVYWYMALTQKPLDQDRDPLVAPYGVIERTIAEYSTLQLSGLRILEIAVKYVHETAPSSDWLKKESTHLEIIAPGQQCVRVTADSWVLLHLDTLLAPQPYIFPEEVKQLKWSDAPEKVHIAKARLGLYDSLAKAEREGAKGPKPDPELLRVFLWSKNRDLCAHTFKWCLELVHIGQSGSPGDGDSTETFIPETMGYAWVEHFVHLLCTSDGVQGIPAWGFLKSHLVPKWGTLPLSWCCDFASVLLSSIVHLEGVHGLPAYQLLIEGHSSMSSDLRKAYLPFLATMLQLIKSSLTWARLTLLENWLANIPDGLDDHDSRSQMEHILATGKDRLAEVTLGFLAELPMAGSWIDE